MIAVIILNWNNWAETIGCLSSLMNCEVVGDLNVVVVDNGSTNDSVEQIDNWISCNKSDFNGMQVTILSNIDNFGFSRGNNIGLDYVLDGGVDIQYVMFLNNDCIVQPGCISRLVSCAADTRSVIAPTILYPSGGKSKPLLLSWPRLAVATGLHIGRRESLLPNECGAVPVTWVCGAALLCSVKVIEEVVLHYGYFWKEDYFLYYEDNDLSLRLLNLSIATEMSLDAFAMHKGGAASARSLIPVYYMSRNRLNFCRDHCNIMLVHLCIGSAIVVGLLKCIGLFFKRDFRACLVGVAAIVDGILGKRGKWVRHV